MDKILSKPRSHYHMKSNISNKKILDKQTNKEGISMKGCKNALFAVHSDETEAENTE